MAGPVHRDDALLLFGDQQVQVEADVGLFLPDTGLWGGFLRDVPAWLPGTMSTAEEVRLRMSTGQERRIRPLAVSSDETSVPFNGGRNSAVLSVSV
ncbi:hypothetical protein [Streptomyces sp. SAI-090]|uniref:hypothetical protein n=1 Tax=Streptomyces sp. SAI-090 TaxID=2940545 RepID=UPI0024730B0C|nr:hypothetical protein [Streptomyces sp. SAI-090]MDH6522134.1 hypothetical protein [Streptomyces sp. SAI-090]